MKKWIGVACLLMCMIFSGCQKISEFFQSPEERLLGHMEDVVEIVANAEHCGKAAKEIQKITQARMEDVAEDSKAFFRDLVKNHDDDNKMDDVKDRLETKLEAIKDKADSNPCMLDPEVITAMADFTETYFTTVSVAMLSVAFENAIGNSED